MKAIVFPDKNVSATIEDCELPELQPDEMRVRTEYSGVSQGTEIWALTGRRVEIKFPTVPGYQAVGVVEALGDAVRGFMPGQRVLFKNSRLPARFPPIWMGAHVSHATVKEAVPLPEGSDPIAASLSALAAVSLRGISMLRVAPGDLVVVTGQGLIGQGSAQLARLRGGIVVTADINPARLALSSAHSADMIVNVSEQNLAEVVRKIKPAGADIVIETTGRSEQFAPCVDLLRREGQLLLQGYYPDPITFDFFTTHLKQPTIAITCGFDFAEVAKSLELMRFGRLHYRELVTHLLPFTDAPTAYRQLATGGGDMLGVVFDWTAGKV